MGLYGLLDVVGSPDGDASGLCGLLSNDTGRRSIFVVAPIFLHLRTYGKTKLVYFYSAIVWFCIETLECKIMRIKLLLNATASFGSSFCKYSTYSEVKLFLLLTPKSSTTKGTSY
uniref:Uncharacterized protein n=1 Tax=Lepeophtheirus salmonis TaxID=72036 RepID=A0A0K2V066_LEPSM